MAKPGKKGEQISISEIARRSGLDRATVKVKLAAAGIRPTVDLPKRKLFDAVEALAAVKADGTRGLRKAQTTKTEVEAERAKIKLEKERGELVSLQDVREDLQELVKRIHQHFAVTAPAALAPQLRGQSVDQIVALLRRDAENFFNELRTTYESYL